jgi:DNA-binding protein YbaB
LKKDNKKSKEDIHSPPTEFSIGDGVVSVNLGGGHEITREGVTTPPEEKRRRCKLIRDAFDSARETLLKKSPEGHLS